MWEHLDLTVISERGHVPYATLLLRGYLALCWRELCESNPRSGNWEEFCRVLHDELAGLHQYSKESVADFVFRFRATCLKIADLSNAEKLDRFICALVPDIRM